jgi:hypothetical protein
VTIKPDELLAVDSLKKLPMFAELPEAKTKKTPVKRLTLEELYHEPVERGHAIATGKII